MMEVLIVEDEAPKRRHLMQFVARNFPLARVRTANSVRSAIDSLLAQAPDLLLLDMSLPTFDVGSEESGGRPQGFGGIEVMRYMDLYGIVAATIVVTAYEVFSKEGKPVGIELLSDELRQEHPTTFVGMVYYNSLFGDWERNLETLIKSAASM